MPLVIYNYSIIINVGDFVKSEILSEVHQKHHQHLNSAPSTANLSRRSLVRKRPTGTNLLSSSIDYKPDNSDTKLFIDPHKGPLRPKQNHYHYNSGSATPSNLVRSVDIARKQ